MGSRNEYMGRDKRFNKKRQRAVLAFLYGVQGLRGSKDTQGESGTSRKMTLAEDLQPQGQ